MSPDRRICTVGWGCGRFLPMNGRANCCPTGIRTRVCSISIFCWPIRGTRLVDGLDWKNFDSTTDAIGLSLDCGLPRGVTISRCCTGLVGLPTARFNGEAVGSNDADTPLISDVGPDPGRKHLKAVPETGQIQNMNGRP